MRVYRQANGDRETRAEVGHAQLGAMVLGNGFHECQAKAVAGLATRRVEAEERLEHVLALVCGYAGPTVRNRQINAACGFTGGCRSSVYGDVHVAAAWCVFDGVVQQIAKRLKE